MSRRLFDEMSRLSMRLAALEIEIAAAHKAAVVDLAELADLRTTRATLLEQIAAKEDAASR